MSQIHSVDAQTLKKWMKDSKALLIDVREPLECSLEKIVSSKNIPLAQITLEDLDLSKNKDKKIVIQCRSGARSMTACKKLSEADPSLELYNLDGGILAWKAQGYNIAQEKDALPLDRQVQLTLGIIIIFGVLMSYLFNDSWVLLPAIIGLGLINAGLTGWCGMAKLVALFPWNRNK